MDHRIDLVAVFSRVWAMLDSGRPSDSSKQGLKSEASIERRAVRTEAGEELRRTSSSSLARGLGNRIESPDKFPRFGINRPPISSEFPRIDVKGHVLLRVQSCTPIMGQLFSLTGSESASMLRLCLHAAHQLPYERGSQIATCVPSFELLTSECDAQRSVHPKQGLS
jgi:hypothetical protein